MGWLRTLFSRAADKTEPLGGERADVRCPGWLDLQHPSWGADSVVTPQGQWASSSGQNLAVPRRPPTALREAWTSTRGSSLHRVRLETQLPVGLGLSGCDHPECDACNQQQVCCFSAVSLPIFKCYLSLLLVNSVFRDGTGRQFTVCIKSASRQFWWVNGVRFGDVDNSREAYENVTWLVD